MRDRAREDRSRDRRDGWTVPSPGTWSVRTWVVMIAVAVIALSRAVSLAAGPALWLDEAMLSVNLKYVSLWGLLEPLPLYGQSAPLGYLLLSKLIGESLGYTEITLRILSVLMSLALAYWLYHAARRAAGPAVAALALILCSLSVTMVHFAIEIKHYMGEAAAGALLLLVMIRLAREGVSRQGALLLVGAYCAGLAFSNGTPFLLCALGGGLFLHGLLGVTGDKGRALGTADLTRLVIAGVVCVLISAAYFVLYLNPSISANFESYAAAYEGLFLTFPPATTDEALRYLLIFRFWAQIMVGEQLVGLKSDLFTTVPLVILLLAGAWQAARRLPFLVTALIVLIIELWVISVMGRLTFHTMRFFMFTYPLVVLLAAWGAVSLVRDAAAWVPKITARQATSALLVGSLFVFATLATLKTLTQERQDIRALLSHIRTHEAWGQVHPIYIFHETRPTIEFMEFPLRGPFLGWDGQRQEGVTPIFPGLEAYVASYGRETGQLETHWLLATHFHRVPEQLDALVARAEQTGATCTVATEAKLARLYRCERPGAAGRMSAPARAR